jgi:HSP20 family protein
MTMAEKPEQETKALSRWDPFGELEAFTRWDPFRALMGRGRLSRLFEDMFRERPFARGELLIPVLDLNETDNEYVVTVELPGVRKEDVSVEITEGVLTVRGEKKSEREEKKERSCWAERSYGSFSRSFTLPANAVPDRIDTSYKDGILMLRIEKREETKPKRIAIK